MTCMGRLRLPYAAAVAGAAALLGVLATAQTAVVRHVGSSAVSLSPSGLAPGPRPVGTVGTGPGGSVGLPVIVMVLLALATTLPLVLLWRRPAAAAVLTCAACTLSLVGFQTLTVAGAAAQAAVLYRAGRAGLRPLVCGALTAPFLGLAVSQFEQDGTRVLTVLLAVCCPLAAWAGRERWARARAAEQDASRAAIAGNLLEHTARGERARISRELHDVVAHHISMIAVQAETARLATPGMPAAGAQRLSAIGDTARAALTEMRRLLGVLREDTGPAPAQLAPQPGLRELGDLLDEARAAAGTGTRLIVSGPPADLDPGVELAAYRIVQEALTNARRHAPGAAVDVELQYRADTLLLRIRDNGPGLPAAGLPAAGLGLVGMRERAAAVGGELRISDPSGGGFVITAVLPARTGDPARGWVPARLGTPAPASSGTADGAGLPAAAAHAGHAASGSQARMRE
jgi:signal transduction histidine kinase